MILSKSFLREALPQATFYCNGKQLDDQMQTWNFYAENETVSIAFDSRLLLEKEIFIALKGERVDGHDFLGDVLAKGAAAFIVSLPVQECLKKLDVKILGNKLIIVVPDTYQALLSLAKCWRTKLLMPVVGITGSIGKTSTKEILRSILQKAGISFYVSLNNQNTFIGLCINLLKVPLDCLVAAFEVGISKPGEMVIKADILRPTIGLITCIAHSHVLDFGSLQNISFEKRQLFKYFSAQNVGIIFGDQPLLTDVYYAHPIAKFGFKTKNQVQARKIRLVSKDDFLGMTEFNLKWYGEQTSVYVKNCHHGLIHNALAASAIAYFLKIPLKNIVEGIQTYQSFERRFETKTIRDGRGVIVSDCYNANPESMKAAIEAFNHMPSNGKKFMVLGDMLELGEKESFWHRQIGRFLNKINTVESIILVGQKSRWIAQTAPRSLPVVFAENWQMAKEKLEQLLPEKNALILVKASKDMALYKMVEELT
jgi:UDP-N-acetylmuramoyl-tripeptide--D-alanyl-D-alanine ligase